MVPLVAIPLDRRWIFGTSLPNYSNTYMSNHPLVGKLVFRNVMVKTYIRLSEAVGERRII